MDITISSERLQNFIKRIKSIIDLDDDEIKKYALLALIEELEELQKYNKE